ncbi:hypothetical protein N7452_010022 [Penicillium brevicompactum]|uniref:CFEM domain-containing protein n=1 Tax=Penicillium brevicompactum TaxID=5074 RepID=A0A9W9QEG2_PENBR|nr:hypothetical protein N7452_010022 [Penicillium brevicompactum]
MTLHLKIKAGNHKASGQLLKLFIPLSAPKSGLVFNSYHRLSPTLSTKLQNTAQITTIRQDEVCCRCPRLCRSRPRPIQGGCPPLCPPCLDDAVKQKTSCATDDYACICKDQDAVKSAATSCVVSKCGISTAESQFA